MHIGTGLPVLLICALPACSPTPRRQQEAGDLPAHVGLAVLASGRMQPAQGEVDRWKRILDRLETKCADESRDRIADMLVAGHVLVNEKVRSGEVTGYPPLTEEVTLLSYARLVDQSTPPPGPAFQELLTCPHMIAAVTTRLITGEPQVIVDPNVGY